MVERIVQNWLAVALGCLVMLSPARAAEPLPPVTPEERAAAFPDVVGTDLHAHMEHDPLTAMLLAEQFEWQVHIHLVPDRRHLDGQVRIICQDRQAGSG